MKKLYTLFCASAFAFASLNANATIHNVSITNFAFTPNNFTAFVGDTVKWTDAGGTHGIEGLSLPAGAAAFTSGTMTTSSNTTYSYKITVAGSYGYDCTIHHTSMLGGFTVTAPLGITDPATDLLTNVYPNPFKEKVNVKYNNIESIEFFNVVGEKIKSVELTAPEGKLEVDFETLPAGIYFYRTYKDGIIFETRKIVKAN